MDKEQIYLLKKIRKYFSKYEDQFLDQNLIQYFILQPTQILLGRM